MKSFLLPFALLLATMSGGCVAATNDAGVIVRKTSQAAVSTDVVELKVENSAKGQQRFSITIEVNDRGQWIEYPNRIEDGLIKMQRPIHAIGPRRELGFVWNIRRDQSLPLPKGAAKAAPMVYQARVRLNLFDAKGVRWQSVFSDPFKVEL